MKKKKYELKLKREIEESYGENLANTGCGLLFLSGIAVVAIIVSICFIIWNPDQKIVIYGGLVFSTILLILCGGSYYADKKSKEKRANFIKGGDPELLDKFMEEEAKGGIVNLIDKIENEKLYYRNKDVIISENYVVTLLNKPLISRLNTLEYVKKEKEVNEAIRVKFVFKSGQEPIALCKHKQEYMQFSKMLKDINIELKE